MACLLGNVVITTYHNIIMNGYIDHWVEAFLLIHIVEISIINYLQDFGFKPIPTMIRTVLDVTMRLRKGLF